MHKQIGDDKIWYQNTAKAQHTEQKHYTGYIIASYPLATVFKV